MANYMVLSQGYHSWHDEFTSLTEPALGVPPHEYIELLPDDYSIDLLSQADAIIIEPLALDYSEKRKLWIKRLREDCTKYDVVLIFDEIITGFRVPQQFIYKHWDVKPDILCLGKAMANGYPLAAVFMSNEAADIEWFASGTYCGEMVSLASCMATLDEIGKKSIKDLWYYANRFTDNLNKTLADIDVKIQGYGTRGFMPLETLNEALFLQEMCKAGVIFGKAFFYGYSHMEAGIDESTLQIASDVVSKIKQRNVKLEGGMPQSSFKRY